MTEPNRRPRLSLFGNRPERKADDAQAKRDAPREQSACTGARSTGDAGAAR